MKNYKQDDESLPLVAPYDVASGGGALIGATFGIASSDTLSGVEGVFQLEGVYTLPKATTAGTGGNQGARAYWVASTKLVTAVSSGNTLIGIFTKTCADSDATCEVRLNGSF